MHQIFAKFKSQHYLSYISRCFKWSEITSDSASCVVYEVLYYSCSFVAVLQIVLSRIMINYRDASCNLSLNRYIVITNRFSKITHMKFIDNLNSQNVIKIYHAYIWKLHDLLIFMIIDRDSQFENVFWNELYRRIKIKARLFTIYHSETDEQIERVNSLIEQYLKVFCVYLQNDWALWTLFVEFVINNYLFEFIKCTSFLVNFDQHLNISFEFARDLDVLDLTTRQHILRSRAHYYVDKINSINQELRSQIIWAQVSYKYHTNQYRAHNSRYAVNNKIWLNIRNIRTKRSNKKLSNKNDESFQIT